MKRSGIAGVLFIASLVLAILIAGSVWVMTYFMNSLAGSILLEALQPMAKTAAQNVEANLRLMADRFFLMRDCAALSAPDLPANEKWTFLESIAAGIEFNWLGIYRSDGTLLAGSEDSPRSVSGRTLWPALTKTGNLTIEDTAVGYHGLEIAMGLPLAENTDGEGDSAPLYLAGGTPYDLLGDVLSNMNIGERGTAFIINDKGTVIAHKALGKVYSGENIAASLAPGDATEETLARMVAGEASSAVLGGADGVFFLGYAPVRGARWFLGVMAPRADFVSAVRQMAPVTAVMILVLALLMATLFLLIRKVMPGPMQAVAKSAPGQKEHQGSRHEGVIEGNAEGR